MEPSRARRLAPLAILAIATAVLAKKAIGGVLEKVGHPAAALDDAYIHFAYARAFAEGHPFRYYPGAPISHLLDVMADANRDEFDRRLLLDPVDHLP